MGWGWLGSMGGLGPGCMGRGGVIQGCMSRGDGSMG